MTFESIFEDTSGSLSDEYTAGASHESRTVETLLLVAILVIAVANVGFAAGHATVLWISCYLSSVFLGVPLLGFHTQRVLQRFESRGHAMTPSTRALRVALTLMLIVPALVAATRLAVEWSSQ